MARQTKNVITRAYIAEELAKDNLRDVRSGRNFFLGISLFSLLFFAFTTCVIAFNIYNTAGRVITFAVGGALFLLILFFSSLPLRRALGERRLLREETFVVEARELYYKSIEEITGRHTYGREEKLLHFGDFGTVRVNDIEYALAEAGDLFYLVYFPERKNILLFYSAKTYEYRENGTAPL